MNFREFGSTGMQVSEIGFGAWAIGGGATIGNIAIGWGNAHDATSKEAIQRALTLGINFLDTADIYGLGHSETIIGNTIGNRKDVIVATKVGNVSRDNQFTVDYSKEYILGACEGSLKRLKRETIDYYQLHSATLPHLQQGDCIEAMQQLQRSGKIRFWGLSLSTFDPYLEAEFMMNNRLGNGFQLVLNILNQRAIPLMKKASGLGYGIIARMPLQFGLLTGKFDQGAKFPENDHRKKRLTEEVINGYKDVTKTVWQLCDKYNVTKAQLAMSFILSNPEVSTVIPGIRTAAQAEDNTQGLVQLEEEDMKLIKSTDFADFMDLIQKHG